MIIYLAADHAGFELKEKIKKYLLELGYEVKDFGAFKFEPADDYPDFMRPAAEAVSQDPENSRGIFIGGSGQGEAMTANRSSGVRAAVVYHFNEDIIRLSREHNNANALCLGARFLTEEEAKKVVKLWLETPFPSPEDKNFSRHQRRLEKINK